MSYNLFSDVGLIFFVSWSFVLARLSVAAFGRDLVPARIRRFSRQVIGRESSAGPTRR